MNRINCSGTQTMPRERPDGHQYLPSLAAHEPSECLEFAKAVGEPKMVEANGWLEAR